MGSSVIEIVPSAMAASVREMCSSSSAQCSWYRSGWSASPRGSGPARDRRVRREPRGHRPRRAPRAAADGGIAVDVTVVGSDAACDGPGGAWLTTGVDFRARYHLVSDEPVLV